MVWATVSSWSRFCWLYRASPSLAVKNIINLDFDVDHLVMSMCRVFSCVVGRGCLLGPVHFLGKTLFIFALLHSVFQGQICLLLQVFLDFYFCIPVPYNEKDIFFVLHHTVHYVSRAYLYLLHVVNLTSVRSSQLLGPSNHHNTLEFYKFGFSHSVTFNSLQPYGLQDARFPCSSPTPRACSNSCPLSWWYHPTISSSVIPFSSCLQPSPASGCFLVSHFFESVAKVLEHQHQSFQWVFRTDFL